MAGDEHHALRMVAVRERHAQRGHGRQAGGDAVDHRAFDAGFAQVLHFFAAAAEDERVAALEAGPRSRLRAPR